MKANYILWLAFYSHFYDKVFLLAKNPARRN